MQVCPKRSVGSLHQQESWEAYLAAKRVGEPAEIRSLAKFRTFKDGLRPYRDDEFPWQLGLKAGKPSGSKGQKTPLCVPLGFLLLEIHPHLLRTNATRDKLIRPFGLFLEELIMDKSSQNKPRGFDCGKIKDRIT